MMKFKKIFVISLVTLALLFVGACSNSQEAPEDQPVDSIPSESDNTDSSLDADDQPATNSELESDLPSNDNELESDKSENELEYEDSFENEDETTDSEE
jgi:hypothetical protein